MIQAHVKAGLARAKAAGTRLGRPKVPRRIEAAIKERLTAGTGMLKVARELGVATGTVQRVWREMMATV
jgi:DNA invertase Pin-like site-specific DNA recombinase